MSICYVGQLPEILGLGLVALAANDEFQILAVTALVARSGMGSVRRRTASLLIDCDSQWTHRGL